MLCPVDGEELLMTERNGVEIDYCPVCRGVWLDRGELDKIIEQSKQRNQPEVSGNRAYQKKKRGKPALDTHREKVYRQRGDDHYHDDDYNGDDDYNARRGSQHKKSQRPRRQRDLLDEIFDFFD